jgi:hypothetical protein
MVDYGCNQKEFIKVNFSKRPRIQENNYTARGVSQLKQCTIFISVIKLSPD